MTREYAIKIFNTLLLFGKCDLRKEEAVECFEMAIKALEEQPSERTEERTETHACDCISREALDNAISGLTYWHFENDRLITGGGGSKTETVYKVDDVTRLTHILPSVSSQPKTGHWITLKDEWGDINEAVCSCCDANGNHKWHYCPQCGAKMQEVQQ